MKPEVKTIPANSYKDDPSAKVAHGNGFVHKDDKKKIADLEADGWELFDAAGPELKFRRFPEGHPMHGAPKEVTSGSSASGSKSAAKSKK